MATIACMRTRDRLYWPIANKIVLLDPKRIDVEDLAGKDVHERLLDLVKEFHLASEYEDVN